MNKELANFTIDTEDESLEIPILQRVYDRSILENKTRLEILEVVRTERFIDVDEIADRLGGHNREEEKNISLLTILEFFDIDYIELTKKRLRNLGVTRYSLITLFESILYPEVFHDTVSVIAKISGDSRFLSLWSGVEFITPSFDNLLKIFDVDLEIFMVKESEDELIEVELGDEVYCPERVLRFENFKS